MDEKLGVDIDGVLTTSNRGPYEDRLVMPYSAVFLNKLKDFHNIEPYIVTDRPDEMYFDTLKWLHEHHIPVGMFFMTNNKLGIAKGFELDAFVEDNPEYAMGMAEDDVFVFLMDKDYNQDIKHDNIMRVKNWREIYSYLSLDEEDLEI